MDDLVTWLRAQLDADEAAALVASQGVGCDKWDTPATGIVRMAGGDLTGLGLVQAPRDAADHIARHDPASVLRDVAAKRAIVDRLDAPENSHSQEAWYAIEYDIALIASAYADRDGYRPEWAPQ
jgi:hypothetical protein